MKVYRFASAPFISLSEWYIILFRENCEADISKYYFFINDVCNIIDLILAPEDERTKPDGRQSGFRFESDQTHIYISDFTYFFFIYLSLYLYPSHPWTSHSNSQPYNHASGFHSKVLRTLGSACIIWISLVIPNWPCHAPSSRYDLDTFIASLGWIPWSNLL